MRAAAAAVSRPAAARLAGGTDALLGALPILLLLVAYLLLSEARHVANPADKVLPTFAAMGRAMLAATTDRDPGSDRVVLVADTLASLWRLGLGLAIATGAALLLGLLLGVAPRARALFGPLLALIAIGVAPMMARDLAGHVAGLPAEQFAKARTLGASGWQLTLRVALPQMMPRLLDALRLSIGPAWVFLIAAEAVAADVGLGYRIFLVRRYFAMDTILPYVAWIALLAMVADAALRLVSRRAFPWAHASAR